jgi:hypothetical protein
MTQNSQSFIPRVLSASHSTMMTMVTMKNNTPAGLLRSFITVLATAILLLTGDAFSTSSSSQLRFLKRLSFRRQPVRLLATVASKSQTSTTRDEAVCKVLDLARQLGPIGATQSAEDQDRILIAAKALKEFSDEKPARQKLGVSPGEPPHCLVYSSSPGGSSGQLFGNVHGKVTQVFNEMKLVNAVELGPLKISLQADLTVKDDWNNKVAFKQTAVQLFGQTVVEKTMKGGGMWKYLFAGVVQDSNGRLQRVRIMETPSLFIISQDVTEMDMKSTD